MKKLFLLLIFIYTVACTGSYQQVKLDTEITASNREEIIKQTAEDYIKQRLIDPASFEFAGMQLTDSVGSGQGNKVRNEFAYTYLFRFKNINGFGSKVLNEFIIHVTPDLIRITKF